MDEASPLVIFILLFISAFITLAYAALNNSRPAQLKEQAENGNATAKTALALLHTKSKLTITYMLCMALVQFLTAILITHDFLEPFIAQYGLLGGLGVGVLGAVVVLIVTQVAPEGIGSVYAQSLLPLLVYPMSWIVTIFSPVTALLVSLSKALAGLFGGSSLVNTVTDEEIMTLVNSGEFEEDEKDMIYSVLQLDQRDARQLMVPRMDVVAVDVSESIEKALDQFIGSGFSRIPVYENSIDHIVGLLYAKDLLPFWRAGGTPNKAIRDLVRGAFFVPETLKADDLLKTMQKRNVHMAIVVDEYGGTSGLVTIENLIEEIVGDIRDEYDQNEETEYTQLSDHEYLMDASMNITDINSLLDLELNENSEYDTIGGYIYTELGRVPHVGEKIETDEFKVTVRSIEGRRIRKVHFIKIVKTPDPDPKADAKEDKTATQEEKAITPDVPSISEISSEAQSD